MKGKKKKKSLININFIFINEYIILLFKKKKHMQEYTYTHTNIYHLYRNGNNLGCFRSQSCFYFLGQSKSRSKIRYKHMQESKFQRICYLIRIKFSSNVNERMYVYHFSIWYHTWIRLKNSYFFIFIYFFPHLNNWQFHGSCIKKVAS